jgi:hypothetical protein
MALSVCAHAQGSGGNGGPAHSGRAVFLGAIKDMPIWMDLRLPDGDGKVTGSYLYLKHGKAIELTGGKTGDSLVLRETLNGKTNGNFRLRLSVLTEESPAWKIARSSKRSLDGTWKKPGKKRESRTSLTESDPAFLSCALLDPDSLELEAGGSYPSLGSEKSWLETDDEIPGDVEWKPEPRFWVAHCADGLAGVRFDWFKHQPPGMISESGTMRHLFDIARRREVTFGKEIDSSKSGACLAYLAKRLDPLLAGFRGQAPDSEWEKALDWREDKSKGIGSFFKTGVETPLELYLEDGKAYVGYSHFLGLDDRRRSDLGIVNDDVFIEVPMRDLMKYLRPGSLLRKLGGGG